MKSPPIRQVVQVATCGPVSAKNRAWSRVAADRSVCWWQRLHTALRWGAAHLLAVSRLPHNRPPRRASALRERKNDCARTQGRLPDGRWGSQGQQGRAERTNPVPEQTAGTGCRNRLPGRVTKRLRWSRRRTPLARRGTRLWSPPPARRGDWAGRKPCKAATEHRRC